MYSVTTDRQIWTVESVTKKKLTKNETENKIAPNSEAITHCGSRQLHGFYEGCKILNGISLQSVCKDLYHTRHSTHSWIR